MSWFHILLSQDLILSIDSFKRLTNPLKSVANENCLVVFISTEIFDSLHRSIGVSPATMHSGRPDSFWIKYCRPEGKQVHNINKLIHLSSFSSVPLSGPLQAQIRECKKPRIRTGAHFVSIWLILINEESMTWRIDTLTKLDAKNWILEMLSGLFSWRLLTSTLQCKYWKLPRLVVLTGLHNVVDFESFVQWTMIRSQWWVL